MKKLTDQQWSDIKERLFAAAEGRWQYIAAQIAPALEPATQRMGKHVPCPYPGSAHQDRSKKRFRLDERSGMAFCSCSKQPIHAAAYHLSGLGYGSFLMELARCLGMEDVFPDGFLDTKPEAKRKPLPPPAPAEPEVTDEDVDEARKRLRRVYTRLLKPKRGGVLAAYQATRGLVPGTWGSNDVFEAPSEPYYVAIPEEHQQPGGRPYALLGYFPAIVYRVRDRHGKVCGLNRIFTVDGRKLRPDDFENLPHWIDAEADLPAKRRSDYIPFDNREAYVVVRPGTGKGRFHACEGIEVGWAIAASTDPEDTVIAHLSNTILEKNSIATPNKGYKSLWIWADNDRSLAGNASGFKLMCRALGRKMPTRLMLAVGSIPEGEKSLDWDLVFKQQELVNIDTWVKRLEILYSHTFKDFASLRHSIDDV